jgi:hypothetical protein
MSPFFDLPPEDYPFTISFYHHTDIAQENPIWSTTVTGPGALEIPVLRKPFDPPVTMKIVWPDGRENH